MKAIIAEKRNSDISDTMSKGGIYLTFALSDKEYGIELLKVRKLVGITTSVPKVHRYVKIDYCSSHISLFFPGGIVPHYVKGITMIHEKMIPIIDLRLKLGFQEAVYTHETCIIIVDSKDKPAGIIVDKILEVLDVKNEEIKDMPSLRSEINTESFIGMVTMNNKKTMLRNIDNVLRDYIVV